MHRNILPTISKVYGFAFRNDNERCRGPTYLPFEGTDILVTVVR